MGSHYLRLLTELDLVERRTTELTALTAVLALFAMRITVVQCAWKQSFHSVPTACQHLDKEDTKNCR